MNDVSVPTYQDILWPTLKALEAKAGSASNEELSEAVADLMKLSDIRDGAPAIDLIDGVELCNLLKKLQLGIRVETIERVSPITDFFENL
jgi:hypothetical protein